MSWSISAKGSKDSVIVEAGRQLDQAASNYGGTEEAEDIKAVKARLLALVDAQVLEDGHEVEVGASGSHHRTEAGLRSATFNLTVTQLRVPT